MKCFLSRPLFQPIISRLVRNKILLASLSKECDCKRCNFHIYRTIHPCRNNNRADALSWKNLASGLIDGSSRVPFTQCRPWLIPILHLSAWIVRIRRLPALPSRSKKIPFQSYRIVWNSVYNTNVLLDEFSVSQSPIKKFRTIDKRMSQPASFSNTFHSYFSSYTTRKIFPTF